jgi:hypothetical protein
MESKPVIGKIYFTVFLVSFLVLPTVFAQDEVESIAFTPQDQFIIPEYNGAISFAFDGSYVYKTFDNNIWRFQNLIVDDYGTSNVPTWYLSISARNCNVTITGYHAPFSSSGFAGWLNYTVTGAGDQTFDNNYYKIDSREINNYTVIIDGIARTQNDGWVLMRARMMAG